MKFFASPEPDYLHLTANIHRIQQVIDAAHRHRRKICIVGRSVERSVEIASELGYLNAPGIIIDPDQIGQYSPQKLAVITTGSQGNRCRLTRISVSDHRWVELLRDTVIISASDPRERKAGGANGEQPFRRGGCDI